MTLRIAMVGACPYPVPQGSQVFLRETALALRQRGHDVCLVVYGHGLGEEESDLPVYRALRLPGAARTAAGPSPGKPFLDLALLWKLKQVVRRRAIDIVCPHNYEALAVALASRRRPVVYFAHNALADELPYYFKHKQGARLAGQWFDRLLPRRADLVIAPHQRLAGHLAVRGCDPGKIAVVPPPMDAEQFAPARQSTEMPPVLYAGNLDSYQNLGLLLEAMRLVRKRAPEAQLQIATPIREASVPGAEIIATPDFQALRAAMLHDSVFAVPRISWSGYPIKLLNAMAAGKAVVACESAAYPIVHGTTGLVVPDNDEHAFAKALLELLMTPSLRRSLGHSAREAILHDHHPPRVAQTLEESFSTLMANSPTERDYPDAGASS